MPSGKPTAPGNAATTSGNADATDAVEGLVAISPKEFDGKDEEEGKAGSEVNDEEDDEDDDAGLASAAFVGRDWQTGQSLRNAQAELRSL